LRSLREAVDAGFGDANRLEGELDLEPLREEEGYRLLLETIRAKGAEAP